MANINGLTMEEMKGFFDLMKKANSCQIFAMIEHAKHEIESRNQAAMLQMHEVAKRSD